jgi:hypothetical protein
VYALHAAAACSASMGAVPAISAHVRPVINIRGCTSVCNVLMHTALMYAEHCKPTSSHQQANHCKYGYLKRRPQAFQFQWGAVYCQRSMYSRRDSSICTWCRVLMHPCGMDADSICTTHCILPAAHLLHAPFIPCSFFPMSCCNRTTHFLMVWPSCYPSWPGN